MLRLFRPLFLPFSLIACTTSTEDQLDLVMTDPDQREAAIMRLMLSPEDVAPTIIETLRDAGRPPEQRRELLYLLRRIYRRESDRRITEALWELAKNDEPSLRRAAIRTLGDVGGDGDIPALFAPLRTEQNEKVLLQIVDSISGLGKWRIARGRATYRVAGGETLGSVERTELEDLVRKTHQAATSDSLRASSQELLYKLACQIVQEAEGLSLSADLESATARFERAMNLAPDCLDVIRRYAEFQLVYGDRDRGVGMFKERDMYIRVPRRRTPPVVDGKLDDEAWEGAGLVNRYYLTNKVMRLTRFHGHVESKFLYTDSAFYAGIARYEDDISKLSQKTTVQDRGASEDDQVGFSVAPGIEQDPTYTLIINSLGAYNDGVHGHPTYRRNEWNGDQRIATFIGPDYWSVEVELPFTTVKSPRVKRGDMWLLNTSFGRTVDSVHARWIPTHGYSDGESLGLVEFE